MADYLLFNHLNGAIVQNIGGIANLTYIPPNKSLSEVIAFDTGPWNMVIDETICILTEGKKEYDKKWRESEARNTEQSYLKATNAGWVFEVMPWKQRGEKHLQKIYWEISSDW